MARTPSLWKFREGWGDIINQEHSTKQTLIFELVPWNLKICGFLTFRLFEFCCHFSTFRVFFHSSHLRPWMHPGSPTVMRNCIWRAEYWSWIAIIDSPTFQFRPFSILDFRRPNLCMLTNHLLQRSCGENRKIIVEKNSWLIFHIQYNSQCHAQDGGHSMATATTACSCLASSKLLYHSVWCGTYVAQHIVRAYWKSRWIQILDFWFNGCPQPEVIYEHFFEW